MKRLFWITILLLLVIGLVVGAKPAINSIKERSKPKFTTAKLKRGDIVYEVRASGTVEPTLKIIIGSFVSGPIKKLYVCDFCPNETLTPNENWHRLIRADGIPPSPGTVPQPVILCNSCKDLLQHRFDKKG